MCAGQVHRDDKCLRDVGEKDKAAGWVDWHSRASLGLAAYGLPCEARSADPAHYFGPKDSTTESGKTLLPCWLTDTNTFDSTCWQVAPIVPAATGHLPELLRPGRACVF